ncbi:hypothetical protein ADK67_44275 [Saccharothrix sp. NRRL B-16348]|uniref:hypothetical protein n=1 Tax=Saccharothrix sp. NRRL B-16348 TaxID=1415542 RepID=UPI0006AF85F4|nr:hypothetical protein [Saccharothrix sp. NRRL B-16348]KOX13349.1 hypothetical protein ADK67_44275 [Saccharothrix sp. NRRL B-16348]
MKQKFLLRSAIAAVAIFAALGASAPAHAVYTTKVGSDTTGSEAWGYKDGSWTVEDTKCDGHAAYAKLKESGDPDIQRKNNRDGCNTTVSGDTGNTVLEIKACTDWPNHVDSCGPWNEWVW